MTRTKQEPAPAEKPGQETFRKANADETAAITAELDALTAADHPVHDP